jgi:hypothetical protein
VLRRIFGPKRDEMTGDWRKLHNKVFHNLYSTPYITTTIKSRKMRCLGYVARMSKMTKACKILVGRRERKNHSEDLSVDGRIIQ